ncbi:hypothetical protein ACQKJG_18080 [Priestia megaterium]|uniref:hypothetical protein n=1 Tax=Priestia megaterium TaxID=1404 RepID=UPI003CFC3550
MEPVYEKAIREKLDAIDRQMKELGSKKEFDVELAKQVLKELPLFISRELVYINEIKKLRHHLLKTQTLLISAERKNDTFIKMLKTNDAITPEQATILSEYLSVPKDCTEENLEEVSKRLNLLEDLRT